MILFTIDALCRLLLDSSETFLVIDMFLTSTSYTTDLMTTDSDHMIQTLALIAASDLAVLMKELD